MTISIIKYVFSICGFLLFIGDVQAQTERDTSFEDVNSCMRSLVTEAGDNVKVDDLKRQCTQLLNRKAEVSGEEISSTEIVPREKEEEFEDLGPRFAMENANHSSRFVLIPHKRNYILPMSYKKEPNSAPYVDNDSSLADLKHAEAEFQFSVKILVAEGVLNRGYLYFGYTNQTFWQLYSIDKSTPFRETNQQPEVILRFYNDLEIFGFRNILNEFAINHQSNGQGGDLSRSWNRLMLNTAFQKNNLMITFKPWYRLPEDEKETPDDARGDDNPDIEKYMGHFELSGSYKKNQHIYSIMFRNNLRSDNKGAVELSWSFPIYKRSHNLHGYIKYFNGYGHSLIDYNDYTQALGVGVVFTDLF